jgi:hypothetical protein
MKNTFFSIVFLLFLAGVFFSCGDSTEFLPGGDRYEMDRISIANGDVLIRSAAPGAGTYCFFRIRGADQSGAGLTLFTDLLDGKGNMIAHNEKKAPAVNADLPIELSPQLPQGQYDLVLTLARGDQMLAKSMRSFFLVNRALSIQGILSYPLVIFPKRTALLIADIDSPAGLDPYLKWTQAGKLLAKGLLRDGYDQILWESPDDDGVYSVELEIYPFPPATGGDYGFESNAKAEAELYISSKDEEKANVRPAALKYNLFDVYASALRERERVKNGSADEGGPAAVPQLRQPVPVIVGDAIGMKFDGKTGFACPELVFPVRSKAVEPFTLALGIKFEADPAGRRLLIAATDDKSLTAELAFTAEGELSLRWKTKNAEYEFPSGIVNPLPGVRFLIEASVAPVGGAGGRLRVTWKLNGAVVAQTEKTVLFEPGERKGSTVIGGENSVRCSIDTFDITLQ